MHENQQASFDAFPSTAPRRLVFPAVALLLAFSLAACSTGSGFGREAGGREASGEHGGAGEGSEGAEGGESAETGPGGGEESATQYSLADTYWSTRAGARLVLNYDAATQRFVGTVTNVTDAPLSSVRVEVHLSNGVELGPTTPINLAPGQTADIVLPATGQAFTTWGAHPEVGSPGASEPMATFTPGFGNWAAVNGVNLGIENPGHQMSAWYTSQGPQISLDAAPAHQPTHAATWTGEWAGTYGTNSAIVTGAASVNVALGPNAPEAALTLRGIPTLGTLAWDTMPVSGGRFAGSTMANSQAYDATGQFGGSNQAGVVGHASGPGFQSVFYGDKT
ncbi:MAG: hypothetical protein F4103_04960 [Boseongicola sp. SB0673_bin_14]|nr:hypothetical protein [Boseongicola sp. SB0673_bin_14]